MHTVIPLAVEKGYMLASRTDGRRLKARVIEASPAIGAL